MITRDFYMQPLLGGSTYVLTTSNPGMVRIPDLTNGNSINPLEDKYTVWYFKGVLYKAHSYLLTSTVFRTI